MEFFSSYCQSSLLSVQRHLAQFGFSLKLSPSLRARKQFGLFKVYFSVHVTKYPFGIPGSLRAR